MNLIGVIRMVEPIVYWVHMLIKFDPITEKSKVIKSYTTMVKKDVSDEKDEVIKLPKSVNLGEVEL